MIYCLDVENFRNISKIFSKLKKKLDRSVSSVMQCFHLRFK